MNELRLRLLSETFSIHRLDPSRSIPPTVLGSSIFFVGRTKEELSIVCRSSIPILQAKTEENWSCFMVEGPLDFNLTGIVARLSGALAAAEISIFPISTFDTDYILVKQVDLQRAEIALKDAGYQI
ncbi:MAG: ACT domain-containing protein [Bacteroidetes bacterium]|nr:ACT domain-containing protein [Bacteroidota bacterium]